MPTLKSAIYSLVIFYLCSYSLYVASAEKDPVLESLKRTYKASPECRALKTQVYTSILNNDDYRKIIRILRRGFNFDTYDNFDLINDHYCMMPLSIAAYGYLNKIDKKTAIAVDDEVLEMIRALFYQLGPNLGEYYYSDKELAKLLPKLLLPEGFIDKNKFSDY